jgi:ABC-type multidrug transport system ATPase subunit
MLLELNAIHAFYGNIEALKGISLRVRESGIVSLLGANGAGKTTAIKILVGLLAPTEGEARVAGFDVRTQINQIRRSIGYMSQRFSLYADLTVRENIQLYGGIYRLTDDQIRDRTAVLLETLGLTASAGGVGVYGVATVNSPNCFAGYFDGQGYCPFTPRMNRESPGRFGLRWGQQLLRGSDCKASV